MNWRQPKAFSLSLVAALALMGSACSDSGSSKGDDTTQDVVGDDVSQYSKASCDFKYDEGGSAGPLLAVANKKITHFDKTLDENRLKPVLAASGAEIVRFAEQTGVKFYKTTFWKQNSCEFGVQLPEAPADLKWGVHSGEQRCG